MIPVENLAMDMKLAAAKKKKQSNNRGSRNRGGGGGGGNYKGISEPMRVVYISNPMKFEIRASEFRRLVQQLTGRDAEFPPSLGRHHHGNSSSSESSSSNCSSLITTATEAAATVVDSSVSGGDDVAPSPGEVHDAPPQVEDQAVDDEQLDEWGCGEFVPEMLENTAVFHSWHFDLDFVELINS
ncbi:unnamed protein product [Linum trigynum]|uniref:VQ domain-containing protein n=1 Tax=Linum trigynum TaxID=586398 RepID=A0AAV2EIN7_9ROSI